jgi:single-strand DNA-binding protein
MYNTIIAAGYLVTDPELRDVKNNNKVCKIRMQISDVKSKTPCYIDVELWNKQAEIANEYLSKGRRIIVQGELSQSSWEKDGKKFTKYFIRGESFKFIPQDKQNGESGEGGEADEAPAASDSSDDIPF